ncbi:MAG: orotidine-5'-phosphate decarboxylase [Candidatus Binatus sp.]
MTQYWPFSGLTRQNAVRERLIVSLDLRDREDALKLVDRLARMVGMFKVGRALFIGGGPDFIREIRRRGAEVFLDLKFHDSPRKVLRAAVEATRLGVKMFDIHPYGSACGSTEMMSRTRAEVARICRSEGLRRPSILAIATLAETKSATSNPRAADSPDRVTEIAQLAADASLDGVVTWPHEVPRVRNTCGRRFIIVTSGVRMRQLASQESRAITAADTIRAGADYVVVGSPIWRAAEPIRAVREITEDIERGLRSSPRRTFEILNPRPV